MSESYKLRYIDTTSFIVNVGIKLPVKDIDIKIQEMAVLVVNISFITSQFSREKKLFYVHTEVVTFESQYIIQISNFLYQMLF